MKKDDLSVVSSTDTTDTTEHHKIVTLTEHAKDLLLYVYNVEEMDIETYKILAIFEKEFKVLLFENYRIIDRLCGYYGDQGFNPDVSPYGQDWLTMLSDDDMVVNAQRLFIAIQYQLLIYQDLKDTNEKTE